MRRFGRWSLAGLLCVSVCSNLAEAQTAKLDALRALAPFVPFNFVFFSQNDVYRAQYRELKKGSLQALASPKLLDLCDVCGALHLDAEEAAAAQEGISRLQHQSLKKPLSADEKVLLARFLTHAKRCQEAIDMLDAVRADMSESLTYWLALGQAHDRARFIMAGGFLPHAGEPNAGGLGRIERSLESSPEIRQSWLQHAKSLDECLAKAKSLAKTKLDTAEVCAQSISWSIPSDAISGLPHTAQEFAESFTEGFRRYAAAELNALSEAPVDAEHAVWAVFGRGMFEGKSGSSSAPVPAGAMSAEDADKKGDAFLARARSSSDSYVRSIVRFYGVMTLLHAGKAAEAYRLAEPYADAHPMELWPIWMLSMCSMGHGTTYADMDAKEVDRLGGKGIRMAEEFLQKQDDRQLRLFLTGVYSERGELAKARPHVDVLLKADPKDPEANLDLAAWLLWRPGAAVNLDEVAKCLDAASAGLEKASADFKAAYRTNLAVYCELKGDHERAVALIDMALRDAPDDEAAQKVKAQLGD